MVLMARASSWVSPSRAARYNRWHESSCPTLYCHALFRHALMAVAPLRFLRAHPAELRHALRVGVAVAAAYGVIKLLGLPQGWWAVITALLVVQTSIGGSFKAALDRLWGTIAGAIYGALVAIVIPHTTDWGLAAAIILAILPLAYLAAVNIAFRVAPVTALIVLLPIYGHAGNPLISAADRIIEIIIGNVVALAVTLVILPARAHGQLREAAARVARLNADLLDMLIAGLFDAGRPGLQAMHASIRAALKRSETAAEEAARERQMRVSDERDPEPVIRTLYRVRHDLVMIGRATARPLPAKLRPALEASLESVRSDGGAMLRGISTGLESKSKTPALENFQASLKTFATALEEDAAKIPRDEAGRLFTLRFALEQLGEDLRDLAARTDELAASPAKI
jgi:uncharacterized membrane protein YccC